MSTTTTTAQQNPVCPECGCKHTVKKGKRRNRLQILQVFKCAECLHRFTTAAGKNKTYPLRLILETISTFIFGTLAHSFVMAYSNEEEAFRRFYQLFPEHGVLLLDTYDTLAATEKLIRAGLRPKGVRLDSGDLLQLSKQVRSRLDKAGLHDTRIFASGDLDELSIADLLARGAPIDAFDVGTALATSKDAPALAGVYKLVDVQSAGEPSYRAKFSGEKATHPGRKQVFRFRAPDAHYCGDIIACADESYDEAKPLLVCVMQRGERLGPSSSLEQIRERAHQELGKLPAACRRLQDPETYPVSFSQRLERLFEDVRGRLAGPAGSRKET